MNKRFGWKALIITAVICSVITGVAVSLEAQNELDYYAYLYAEMLDDSDGLQKLYELKGVIDAYYIGEYDNSEMFESMSAGMVDGIDDKWSYYLTAEEYEDYNLSSANTYVGIGVTISYDEITGGYAITAVAEEGPARDAGFETGDIIIAVEGESVIDYDINTVKSMVVGEEGTSVEITILRESSERTLKPVRGIARYEVVTGEMLDSQIGYIKITNFEGGAADGFKKALNELIAEGATALVFDVRNNPGGMVDEMAPILDVLLPECEVFYSVDYAGRPSIRFSDADYIDMPFVVLVNEYSFSAAEFFAAILQEYGVADIVGAKTTGKGYYQIPIEMSDGSAVVLSVGKYYTPNRVSLAETGVTPDFLIDMDDESFAKLYYGKLDTADDEQLQFAVEMAKQR